jgi:hypothetical protein
MMDIKPLPLNRLDHVTGRQSLPLLMWANPIVDSQGAFAINGGVAKLEEGFRWLRIRRMPRK